MNNQKKLLILGAGRGQLGLYQASKELGYYIVAGTLPNAYDPCLELADEILNMDISSPDDVMKKTKNLTIDGVATCCLDTGLHSLGRLCDEKNLIGISEYSAVMCSDKLKMKESFLKNGVNSAKFMKVENESDLENCLNILNLPIIVKATDLQGSNGIYIAHSRDEAYSGFRKAINKTNRSYVIIEEFIEGYEFGAQAFIYNNEVLFVMPHGDETFMSHTAVPIGHYVPFQCDEIIEDEIVTTCIDAIKSIKLNNCAVNIDLIIKDGKVYVIELTGRVGANCLPELVEINFGIEYYKMIAKMSVGENPLDIWNNRRNTKKAGYAKMLFTTKLEGELKKNIEYKGDSNDDILQIQYFVGKGNQIRKFENSNDCIGQVIVQGDDLKYCEQLIEYIVENINYEI